MGNWSKWEFGKEKLPKRCYIFAGMTPIWQLENIKSICSKIIYTKHDNYNPFLVEIDGKERLLLFQVYGAAMIADLVSILKDGDVEEIIFLGAAYGILDEHLIGDYVIPRKVQCLDGVTKILGFDDYTYPNKELLNSLLNAMKDANRLKTGTTISVPSTFWHPSKELFDKEAIALEMEFASLCTFAEKLNIKTAGVLVISDSKSKDLLSNQSDRHKRIYDAFIKINNCLTTGEPDGAVVS